MYLFKKQIFDYFINQFIQNKITYTYINCIIYSSYIFQYSSRLKTKINFIVYAVDFFHYNTFYFAFVLTIV